MPARGDTEAPSLPMRAGRRLLASYRNHTGSAADRVQGALAEGIERGWLEPGARLGEELLAEAFTVSRTPVREALFRLESERFIERDPHGGVSVARISQQQIIELYVVREALDGAAARLAAGRAAHLEIAKLRHVNEAMRSAAAQSRFHDMANLNIDFHNLLATASGNSMLVELIGQVHRFVRRFRTTTFSYSTRAFDAVQEHDMLIGAIVDVNPDDAERLARSHMRTAMEVRIQLEAEGTPVP